MTTAHTLQRTLTVGLAALGMTFALAGTASADASAIPDDVVVVSSTVARSALFTMTATNVGSVAVDLHLAAPGDVSRVTVDLGSYDDRWMIDDLSPGTAATMTGLLAL